MRRIARYCGLAALIAGAAFCLPSCDCDDPTGPEPYDGPWKIVPCPEGPSYLKSVFFLNPDLGYAVGCRHILKFEGTEWKIDFAYKENSERYVVALEDVWFNAADDGWVAGREYDTVTKTSDALLLRYDGNKWKRFAENTPATSLDTLFFLNKNEGWAAGFGICHWDGTSWEYISDLERITDIYFSSPTDGWATYAYNEKIYHYDGTSWTKVHEDPWGIELYSIWFTSPGHGWAGGSGVVSGTQSNILEYKNGQWRYYQGEPWNEGIRRDVSALHLSAFDNGWAVGQTTFRWDGERWWYVKDPPDAGPIYDVFTISGDDAWAVGYVLMHYEP